MLVLVILKSCTKVLPDSSRKWRNWQTRRPQEPVRLSLMGVQVPPSAPTLTTTLALVFVRNSPYYVFRIRRFQADRSPVEASVRGHRRHGQRYARTARPGPHQRADRLRHKPSCLTAPFDRQPARKLYSFFQTQSADNNICRRAKRWPPEAVMRASGEAW